MPRKTTRPVSLVNDDDDASSQHGKVADDDQDLEVYAKAVAEFKVTWQKQKREKERKFLKATQAELDEHTNRKKGEVNLIINEMEEMYQEFLLKYAVLEEKQREVIVKIIDAQQTLVALSVRKHQETVQLTQDREEGQFEGMKELKQTFQDMEEMVDSFMKV